jgi:hypothetical protein
MAEVRDGISDVSNGSYSAVHEVFDIPFIKSQLEAGVFGWDSCINFVSAATAIVKRAQAPKRDTETNTLWTGLRAEMVAASDDDSKKPTTFCNALKYLLDRVNAMRIDAANARLRLLSPIIRDHGCVFVFLSCYVFATHTANSFDYERGKFQDKVNDGTLTLERTTAWIKMAIDSEPTLHQALSSGDRAAFVQVWLFSL